MTEEKKDLEHYENGAVERHAGKPIQHKTIKEIQELEKFKKKLVSIMKKGEHGKGSDYGSVPGIDHLVFKEGVQMVADAFNFGYGYIKLQKEDISLEIKPNVFIIHWNVTAQIPIVNLLTGQIIAVGWGSCSTMEDKYRFRGQDRICPKCGKEAIIKGLEKFGGGWICYKKKDGCGEKFEDNADEIISQPVGKTENLNPINVLDTVEAMAIKRGKGRVILDITGMSKYFQLPPEIRDDGDLHHGSHEQEEKEKDEKAKKYTEKKPPKKNGNYDPDAKPTEEDALKFHDEMKVHFKDSDSIEQFLKEFNNYVSDVFKIKTYKQLNFFKGKFRQLLEDEKKGTQKPLITE